MGKWSRRIANSERGQASMVTVAMFMMLFAVVAVSFTYIVVSTTRQSTNETLQSSAKAAAESGVEDAKRLLIYCYSQRQADGSYTSPETTAVCSKVIGHKLDDLGCQDILGAVDSSSIGDNFAIETDDNGDYQARIGGEEANDEYYQCLKIATMTTAYQGVVNADGNSVVVPLKLVDAGGNVANPTRIEISWHRNIAGESGDRIASGVPDGSATGLVSQSAWNNGVNRPAIVRAEIVGASKNGGVSVNDLIANDSAITLRPSSDGSGGALGANPVPIMDYHPQHNNYDGNDDAPNDQYGGSGAPIIAAKCANGASQNYACIVSITPGGGQSQFNVTDNDYYMRLNAIYKNTHFSIAAYRGDELLYFDGVQPVVDVTGNSADAFARIQANLEPTYSDEDASWWPDYAIETEGKVCKDINVFYDNGVDNCDY